MGLDTSHDCYHGSYHRFHLWRKELARAVGIELDQMQGYEGVTPWSILGDDALVVLLDHSDCDGSIAAEDCARLADRLEEVLPLLRGTELRPRRHSPYEWRAGVPIENEIVALPYRYITERFIKGLRAAAQANEDVEFY